MVDGIGRRRRWRDARRELVASPDRRLRELQADREARCAPTPLRTEQTNTSVNLGDRLLLKLFRKVEPGLNPDLEIGRHPHRARPTSGRSPMLAGGLELRTRGREPITLGVLHQFVPSEGDAWRWTLNALSQFFERALVADAAERGGARPGSRSIARAQLEPPAMLDRGGGGVSVPGHGSSGRRTAELHLALASHAEHPAFAPEPFTGALPPLALPVAPHR